MYFGDLQIRFKIYLKSIFHKAVYKNTFNNSRDRTSVISHTLTYIYSISPPLFTTYMYVYRLEKKEEGKRKPAINYELTDHENKIILKSGFLNK